MFGAEFVSSDDFDSEIGGVQVAARIQTNGGDEGVVRHHHRHRPEQHFQIVGKFGTTRVSWIHGDANVASGNQIQYGAFELELLDAGDDGPHDAEDLLGDHGQYLQKGEVMK